MQYSAWQLSAEHRAPPAHDRQPPGLAPATHMHANQVAIQASSCPWALGPRWSLGTPMKPKRKQFKNPHPQILNAILGQMNKQKLLLLTFMQNNRGEIGHGSGPHTGRGWSLEHRSVPLA